LTQCEYCETSFYLPKEIWQRFHPVKTAKELFFRARFTPEDFRRARKSSIKLALASFFFMAPFLAAGPVVGALAEWADSTKGELGVVLGFGGLLASPAIIFGIYSIRKALRQFRDAGRVAG
jgi:hypothetical protein